MRIKDNEIEIHLNFILSLIKFKEIVDKNKNTRIGSALQCSILQKI